MRVIGSYLLFLATGVFASLNRFEATDSLPIT